MYDFIHDISLRPAPFSRYTAKALWTRPHLSSQMLEYHLNQATDLASCRTDTIDRVVQWIDGQLGLQGEKLCDLGCGPGLYTQRFDGLGAKTVGIDFSHHSLDYAKSSTHRSITYFHADYLVDQLPSGFDIITLIYTDFCVLSPDQRKGLLGRMRQMLNPGGHIVLDVLGSGALTNRQESTLIDYRLMNGFWAPGDYVGIQKSFTYPELDLGLDRYVIVEPDDKWEIYNWFQYFTPESISTELKEAGFIPDSLSGNLTGLPLTEASELLGVIATIDGEGGGECQ